MRTYCPFCGVALVGDTCQYNGCEIYNKKVEDEVNKYKDKQNEKRKHNNKLHGVLQPMC